MGEIKESPSPHLPSAPPIEISPHLFLQPPLSRRGHGPGLIVVLDHYAPLSSSDKTVDPPPMKKWAEEGFAVAMILVPGKPVEFALKEAVEALRRLKECDADSGFGLISYLTRIPFYVEEAVRLSPDIKAIVSYNGKKLSYINAEARTIPQLLHASPMPPSRRESITSRPDAEASLDTTTENVKSFQYPDTKPSSSWILPSDPDYHASSAGLSHTRTLSFLKPLLGGPWFDLEAIWEEHTKYEFAERDLEKTMATMVDQPYVNHIPVLTGGIGRDALTAFYKNHFIFANPADTTLELVSRTVGIDRIIDEFVFKCTHNRVIDWLLPGVPATGRPLSIPFTSIVNVRGDRLFHEHIAWDQATALAQTGLMPEWVNFPYPIDGKQPAEGKRFEVKVPVAGAETAKKLIEEGSEESNRMIAQVKNDAGWREVDNE